MNFPVIVYRDKGEFSRPGGTFSTKQVVSDEDYLLALAGGWFPSLPEAAAGVLNVVEHAADDVVELEEFVPTEVEVPVEVPVEKRGKHK